jgi:drug/metabolite transporter (DMT)-like permease
MSKNEVKEDKILHNEEKQPLLSQSHIDNSLRQKTEVSIIIKHDTSEFDLFKGLIFMSLSCLFKSLFSIFSKMILKEKKELSSFQMLTFRTYFMFWISFISLIILRINIFSEEFIKPKRLFQVCLRTVFALASMSLVIYSLKYMNISDVYAIYYVYPGLVILLSYIFLKEKLGPFDFICLVSCFIGAILIIKPEFLFHQSLKSGQNDVFYIFVFCGALFKSAEDVIVREVKDDVHFMAYPFFYSLIGILLFPIPMAINDRVYPSFNIYEVFLLFLIGLCTFMYQMFMALGLQNENAGRVSMINYLQVALMYLSDLFIFHKNFQWLDFTGIMLIFGFNFTNGILKAVARMKQLEEVKKKHQNEQANTNGLPQPDLRNNTSPTSNNV